MSKQSTPTVLKEDDSSKQEFAVKDIYVAAYLMAIGHSLEMARSDGYQSEFYFKDVPSKDFIIYYNGLPHPQLSAKKLFDAFQNARRVSRQVRLVPGEHPQPDEDDN